MKKIVQFIKKHKKKCIFIILILIIIRTIWMCYIFNYKYSKSNGKEKIQVMVVEKEKVNEDKISYIVKYQGDKFILSIYNDKNKKEEEFLDTNEFVNKYGKFKYGDNITFRGEIVIPEKLGNPYEFDYKLYLNSRKITGTIMTYDIKKVGESYGNPLYRFGYFLRESIEEKIDSKMPYKEAQLYKSMIYGEDTYLDEEVKEDIKKNGLSHITSVSGANISDLLCIFVFILNINERKNKKLNIIISIFIIVMFAAITGFELSLIRAVIMSTITMLFYFFNLQANKYLKLIITLVAMVLYNPFCIFNIGMQLTFAAILGITIYKSEISSFLDVKLKRLFKLNYIEQNKVKIYSYKTLYTILNILSFTISAQIFILPIQLYYFQTFEIATFISNILIVPLLSLHSIIGFLSLLLVHIPYVSDIVFNAEYFFLYSIIKLCDFIANLNLYTVELPRLHFSLYFIYYAVLIIFRFKKYFILYFKKKHLSILNSLVYVTTFVYIAFCVFSYMYVCYFENYIYFFNVEQGNMAFIRYNRKNIVIDIGSTRKTLAANVLSTLLKAKNIKKIDLLILTHMHSDHVNGLYSIEENIEIERVAYSIQESNLSEEFTNVQEQIEKRNIGKIISSQYDNYKFDDINIQILLPYDLKKIKATDEENANSQVIIVSIKDKNFLFMGDATIESERELLECISKEGSDEYMEGVIEKLNNLEVLQVGHHGSKTSTSEEFLSRIKVKEAVISAKKEKYGHPHSVTTQKLNKYNIKIRITELEGALKYSL